MIAKTFSCNVCSLILQQFVDSQFNNARGIGESVINCNTTRSLMSCVCSALFFFPLPGILDSGVREQILLDGFFHMWTGPCSSSFVMHMLVQIGDTSHSTG